MLLQILIVNDVIYCHKKGFQDSVIFLGALSFLIFWLIPSIINC